MCLQYSICSFFHEMDLAGLSLTLNFLTSISMLGWVKLNHLTSCSVTTRYIYEHWLGLPTCQCKNRFQRLLPPWSSEVSSPSFVTIQIESAQLLLVVLSSILLQACDVERNPGPRQPKYSCGVCSKACSSYKGAKVSVLCESWDTWFHSNFAHISDYVFNTLTRTDLPWECCRCGMANFSTSLFNSTLISESSTSTKSSSLSSTCSISSPKPGSPLAHSSPTSASTRPGNESANLRTLTINFESVHCKRAEFWCLLNAVKSDVILGCETWLKLRIAEGEIFLPGFNLYRKDRSDGYGGVLIGVHSSLNSHRIDIYTNAEFIAVEILNGNQNFIVALAYRPTDNNQLYSVTQ